MSRSTDAVVVRHLLAMTAAPFRPTPVIRYTADFFVVNLRTSIVSGSTRSGSSWLQALTARCSAKLAGNTSSAVQLRISGPRFGSDGFPFLAARRFSGALLRLVLRQNRIGEGL